MEQLCYKYQYTGCLAHYGGNSEVFSHINKDLILLLTEIIKNNNFD